MSNCSVCHDFKHPKDFVTCEDCGGTVCVYHYARIQKTLKTEFGDKYIKVKDVCPVCFLPNKGWRILAYGMFGGSG